MKLELALILAAGLMAGAAPGAESPKMNATNKTERATFGGGCFWCTEALFERVEGVISVTSGYAGGKTDKPTYKEICQGDTGHAEVTQIEFDPAKIRFAELVELFWDAHDPTTLNRQGADVGTQYRSVIFYHSDEQKKIAEAGRAQAQKNFDRPIVTEISPLAKFFPAEESHQDYFRANPRQGYCVAVIRPKLEKFLKLHGKKTTDPARQK